MLQALEFERDRETALVEQLQEVAAEAEGTSVDEAAFAKMEPEDVALVRDALVDALGGYEDEDSFELEASDEQDEDGESGSVEEEIGRLESEIATCRSRQRAYTRYLEALGT